MKIAYIIEQNLSEANGVSRKILMQALAWKTLSHDVRIFCISKKEPIVNFNCDISITHIASPKKVLNQIFALHLLPYIDNWKPDIIYMRWDMYNFTWEKLTKKYPLVLEINTDNLQESLAGKRFVNYLFLLLLKDNLLKKVHGMVFVTNELKNRFCGYQAQKEVISNGINLAKIKPLNIIKKNRPQLIFMASDPCYWHGIDKIEELAVINPEWDFILIGNYSINKSKKNIKQYNLLTPMEYEHLLSESHIAIGTLGLYRKNMDEACPIKVREYLAYGLPVIIGYKDTDFTPPPPFILQIPNTESNIRDSIHIIRNFVREWKGKQVKRDSIQQIDIMAKEQQRIAFFERVASLK